MQQICVIHQPRYRNPVQLCDIQVEIPHAHGHTTIDIMSQNVISSGCIITACLVGEFQFYHCLFGGTDFVDLVNSNFQVDQSHKHVYLLATEILPLVSSWVMNTNQVNGDVTN